MAKHEDAPRCEVKGCNAFLGEDDVPELSLGDLRDWMDLALMPELSLEPGICEKHLLQLAMLVEGFFEGKTKKRVTKPRGMDNLGQAMRDEPLPDRKRGIGGHSETIHDTERREE